MKILSQRSLLLFGVMLVVGAFVPSMASAASWSVVGTTHQLFSSNLGFTAVSPALGDSGSRCNASAFDVDVTNASTLTITSGVFTKCHGTQNTVNCTLTPVGTNFPWTATASSTTNVTLNSVRLDVTFENTPGNPVACPANGARILLTGNLTSGSWNSTANTVTYTNAPGLAQHGIVPASATVPTILTGSFRDTANTLRLFD